MEKLRTDQFWLGILLGILLPITGFGVLFLISKLFAPQGKPMLIPLTTILLVAIFINMFTLRYYLVKLKFDRTGRGILMVTFILAILYFAFFDKIGMIMRI